MALNALGYQLAEHVIDSADHGVPQHRERLFVVGLLGLAAPRLTLPRRAHVPVSTVADFDAGRWALIEKPGRAAATLVRVAVGRAEHGERFAMSYYGSTRGGRSLSRPLGTLTTRDRWALIDGDRMRMLSIPEAVKVMGFPEDYALPPDHKSAMHMLGNAVCPPVARDVVAAVVVGLAA
jgi:DNA (cytosine-5)-methyltransferase 1